MRRAAVPVIVLAVGLLVPRGAAAWDYYQGDITLASSGPPYQECVTSTFSATATGLRFSRVTREGGFRYAHASGGTALGTVERKVVSGSPCTVDPTTATAEVKIGRGRLTLSRPKATSVLGLFRGFNWSYRLNLALGTVTMPAVTVTVGQLPVPEPAVSYPFQLPTLAARRVFAARRVAFSPICVPPSDIEGHQTTDYATVAWHLQGYGHPRVDKATERRCRIQEGHGYTTMQARLKAAVSALYRKLDAQGAVYQFLQGHLSSANIAVQFPPSYKPNLRKFQAAARAVGLRGPTAATPTLVRLK